MAKTYNTIPTFTSGQVLTAAQMNGIGTNVNNYRVPPMCRVTRNSTLGIDNTTDTFVTWTTSVTDTGNTESPSDPMFSAGSPDKITIKTAGIYVVTASVFWQANATGTRVMHIMKNPSSVTDAASAFASNWISSASSTLATVTAASGIVSFSANDTVKVTVYQNSGSGLNVGDTTFTGITQLSVAWVGQVS